jgi:putative transcriptional regulator
MPISFQPMRDYMKQHHISFYRLGNEGIDAQTMQRLRHDRPITTETLGKLCRIMNCQPGDLLAYLPEDEDTVE